MAPHPCPGAVLSQIVRGWPLLAVSMLRAVELRWELQQQYATVWRSTLAYTLTGE